MTKPRLLPSGGIQRMVLDNKGDRSLERLSKDCGGRPTAAGLQKMTTNELKAFPDVETIRGLSRGLNVPVRDVVLACARSVGLEVGQDADDVLPLIGAKRLPLESQQLLASISRAWLDFMEPSESDDSDDPTQDMLDLAAHKGDPHIGPDDLPYE